MKEHVIRLMPGEDIILSLDAYCRKHDIEAAYMATCVGSLNQVTFRKGHNKQINTFKGAYEIVSMTGTLSKGGMHLHGSMSDEAFKVIGGHLIRGCIVQATAEIVIVEMEGRQLTRSKDEVSGFKELKITETYKNCEES